MEKKTTKAAIRSTYEIFSSVKWEYKRLNKKESSFQMKEQREENRYLMQVIPKPAILWVIGKMKQKGGFASHILYRAMKLRRLKI